MATRATYQIGNQTFYCHWDGYPAGAAQRFFKMIEAYTVPTDDYRREMEDRRGGLQYAFIRGVMDAEPTESRDEHGDTEFHYEVTVTGVGPALIRVQQPDGWGDDRKWKTVSVGPLVDFVNAQRLQMAGSAIAHQQKMGKTVTAEEVLSDWPEVTEIVEEGYEGRKHYRLATKPAAAKLAKLAAQYAETFQDWNVNKKVYEQKAVAYAAAA
jgi:hypothetical protein